MMMKNLLTVSLVSFVLLHSPCTVRCQILGDEDSDVLPVSPVPLSNSSLLNNETSSSSSPTADISPVKSNLTVIQSKPDVSESSSEAETPALIDKKFLTTWKLESSENFEEFLKELGEWASSKVTRAIDSSFN